MTQLKRVVWSEGMHLAQHHFQAQSRYVEDSIHYALASLMYAPYGVAGCELDAEALRNGTVSLVHARGVMPDGLAFRIPDADAAPAPLAIRELFSPTQDNHLVLLAVPAYRANAANVALDGGAAPRATRYVAQRTLALDETTGRDERPVDVGRKNFRLVLDAEPTPDDVTLPIARVRRDGTGHFVYDREFIPPSLQVGASPRLMELLARLVEILDSKGDALSRSVERGQDVSSFWLRHAVRSSAAPLRHHLQLKRAHPEALYSELVRLGGALCTFSLESHPRDLPAYDHDRLEDVFGALDAHVRAHLDVIVPTRYVLVPLAPTAPNLHTGTVTDRRCFLPSSVWILGVRAAAPAPELAAKVPTLVKACASKFTMELVRRAYPGMRLDHLPAPPPSIDPRPDTQYYSLGKGGPCWDTLNTAPEIGVHVPDAIPGAEVELLVMLESARTSG